LDDNRMAFVFIPAISLPAITLLSSFVGALLAAWLIFGSYKRYTVLAVTAGSACITFTLLLGFCRFTNEPYFAFYTQPMDGWGELALFVYQLGVGTGGLALAFTITAALRFLGYLRQNLHRPQQR
jgi:hypothetical protein